MCGVEEVDEVEGVRTGEEEVWILVCRGEEHRFFRLCPGGVVVVAHMVGYRVLCV